jgi:hypothetical protein
MCGGAASDLVEQAFAEHGKLIGENTQSQGKYELNTAPGIYKALNDYYLNGMPCDQADMVISSQTESLIWETSKCLQELNWKRSGVDSRAMVKFYLVWQAEFVRGANPDFRFRQIADRLAGDTINRYEISRVE